jgi:transposase-like protein
MTKKIEWIVLCPDCNHKQSYHSHRKRSSLRGKRRKTCEKCGRSFLAKEGRERFKQYKKKLKEEVDEKGTGFHKYSKT